MNANWKKIILRLIIEILKKSKKMRNYLNNIIKMKFLLSVLIVLKIVIKKIRFFSLIFNSNSFKK